MSDEDVINSEEYQKESAFLLERIRMREDLVELLKRARPDKIPELRRCIAKVDDVIEQTERIMQMHVKKHELEIEIEEQDAETMAMCDAILPELLAHLEKHNPEAYEKLKAELEDDEDD
jgi:5,10-methenyltetrahydromethanopterin hydrogenase